MQAAIEKFKQYLTHRYPGRSTTKHYMSDLAIFCDFVGAISPKDVTIQKIDQFVQMQSEKGLKPATINRRLSTISSFFEYLISEQEEAGWQNPVHWRRHSIRPGQHIPRDVSEQTVEALLAVIEDHRDRAMVLLMMGAGLRIGEVVGLEMSDIGEADASHLCRLRVHGKGDKERIVWITQNVLQHLQNWLAERPPVKNTQVFLNQHGRPLSVSGVQFRINQYCQRAGVQLTAHQLRHTFARRLVENHFPVESLAKLLGHNQLTTTQRYIDGADPTLREDFLQAITRIQTINTPESIIPSATQEPNILPISKNMEDRPNTNVLLDMLQRLAEDLPDWLQELIHEHTRRRAARWPDHRLKAQLHMHFSSLCRTGRWLVQNRHWQQLDGLQRYDLVAFVHARETDGWKPRSIAAQLTIFRMFWRDLLAEERVSNGAILQVEAPIADAPLPRYLTVTEYQQLEQVVQHATAQDLPEDRFNQAWFKFWPMPDCG